VPFGSLQNVLLKFRSLNKFAEILHQTNIIMSLTIEVAISLQLLVKRQ